MHYLATLLRHNFLTFRNVPWCYNYNGTEYNPDRCEVERVVEALVLVRQGQTCPCPFLN